MKKLICMVCLVVACTISVKAKQVKDSLKSESYITRYGNLDNFAYRVKVQKEATVVFFGGSITNMAGWRGLVCKYLSDTYPGTHFNFINAGIPSLGSLPHAFRLEKDVLGKGKIDLLFVESAVNDSENGTNEITQRRALEGIVRHTLSVSPYTNIVMMAFADENKMAAYNAGKIPVEVRVHEDVAKQYHLPFINLAKEVTDRINAGEFNWKDDFKNLHPSPFGQNIYFKTIKQLLAISLDTREQQKPVAATLPKPADELNYEHGRYLDISKAVIKQGFAADPSWQPADGIPTRPGFVQVPMLEADNAAASLELSFTGSEIGIAIVSGPDAGIINYSIDGKDYPPLDLYTRWSKGLHLPWYLILDDGLAPGKHLLKLQVSDQHNQQSKGTACRIVYFLQN